MLYGKNTCCEHERTYVLSAVGSLLPDVRDRQRTVNGVHIIETYENTGKAMCLENIDLSRNPVSTGRCVYKYHSDPFLADGTKVAQRLRRVDSEATGYGTAVLMQKWFCMKIWVTIKMTGMKDA